MYVNAFIEESDNRVTTLPSEAVVNFDDKDYIFTYEREKEEAGKAIYRIPDDRGQKRAFQDQDILQIMLPAGLSDLIPQKSLSKVHIIFFQQRKMQERWLAKKGERNRNMGNNLTDFIQLMNKYGSEKEPFMFIIDFEMKFPEIHKLDSVPPESSSRLRLYSNAGQVQTRTERVSLDQISRFIQTYSEAFRNVHRNISLGNSYLLNLTFPTVIETGLTLEEIFYCKCCQI